MQVFSDLRKHVKAVISGLIDTETHHTELIQQEILRFSDEIGSIVAHQHEKPALDSNGELATMLADIGP